MSDEKPADDGPPPVPGVEIFDDLAPVPVAPVEVPAALAAVEPPLVPQTAHPVLRAFAFFLDGAATVVITTIVVFAGLNADYGFAFVAILVVPTLAAVLATVLTAVFGFSPAKALLGLRVVDAVTGKRLGWRSILRSLVIVAPVLLNVLLVATAGVLFSSDAGLAVVFFLPLVLWIGLLGVMVARRGDRYRGVQDLAARSVVVRR